jgi:hypothetical protein
VRRSALLQLVNMGVTIERRNGAGQESEAILVSRGPDTLRRS